MPTTAPASLTLVLPAYNEAARIGPALDELFAYLDAPTPEGLHPRIDVLLVDDGSTDGTAGIVRDRPEAARAPGGDLARLAILSVPHAGKGAAVKAGMLAAKGDLIVFADADMATPPSELPKLVEALASADVALGSRIQPDGSDMRATQPRYRRALGGLFHLLASIWVVGDVKDTQCGFKGFTREAAHDLFARQRVTIDRVRRGAHPPRPTPGLPDRGRPDPLGGRPRVAHAPGSAPRAARRVGPVPHPAPASIGPQAAMSRSVVLTAGYGVALAGALAWAALIIVAAASNGTLGFDYRAYDLAVDHLLAGQSMYDPNAQATGSFGLFFYPPPFALLVVPFALLPTDLGIWAWTITLTAASAIGIWLLPVSARVRWIVLLLAACSWPLVYAIKLGQVGPVLLLLFAIGWRWLERPLALGLAGGVGTVIKLQPALLIGWALVTGRRRAALIAVAIAGVARGRRDRRGRPQSWLDEASLLGRVSRPVLTPNAFGFGRLAYEAGFSESVATLIHWANLGLVVAVVALVVWRGSTIASYLAVVIATQFVSPVLWDHYALILLLPVAWLIDRGVSGGPR